MSPVPLEGQQLLQQQPQQLQQLLQQTQPPQLLQLPPHLQQQQLQQQQLQQQQMQQHQQQHHLQQHLQQQHQPQQHMQHQHQQQQQHQQLLQQHLQQHQQQNQQPNQQQNQQHQTPEQDPDLMHQQLQVHLPHSDGQRSGTISLAVLIDHIVQRTYHELTVLAEILPKKSDIERKIEIHNFAARTRQLFVRLLALVKWANSASKVDKSAHIMAFLDKQSLLFVDTADMLARMARETLVNACLPDFQIPAAVEVLTTGTYGRLPQCIRDRVVPQEPITPVEKENTLLRLNQVIQHRLVTGNVLPQMRNVKIEGGRATFHVKHEFEVSLTVMGDGPNIPWKLLNVEILVDDKDCGGGQPLVHPLQVDYVQEVIQARLTDCPHPLNEVYNILHFFAQSLQLEVLYAQALRLKKDRLGDHISIYSYVPGDHLTISYWCEVSKKDANSEMGYKFSTQVNQNESAKPLAVLHLPHLGCVETDIAEKSIHSGVLSLERLLVHTIHIRTKSCLTDLKAELQTLLPGVECTVSGVPTILSVPLLYPCQRAEQMLITIETYTGIVQCCVPQYDAPMMGGIQVALNGDKSKLPTLLSELRFWVMKRRCEKTLMQLPVTVKDYLPLLSLQESPLASRLGRHHMLVQLNHHSSSILIIDLHENKSSTRGIGIDCSFYLASVKPASVQDDEDSVPENGMPKPYLKVVALMELNTFVATHGPCTSVDESPGPGKRKWSPSGDYEAHLKSKHPAYFIPELAHIVSMCEDRIPFISLTQELSRRSIPYQGIQVESDASGLVLRLLTFPTPEHISSSDPYYVALLQRLLSISIRSSSQAEGRRWILELVFSGSPVQSLLPREQGSRRPVYLHYDMLSDDNSAKTINAMLADWVSIAHLYMLAEELSEGFKSSKYNLPDMCSVKSFNYLKLTLGYGPNKSASATIGWSIERKAFYLLFGPSGRSACVHVPVRSHLEVFLNKHNSCILLIQVLHETYEALASISKLSSTPHFGVISTRPTIPIQTWNIIALSPTTLRLIYEGTFGIEVKIKGNGCVSLKDGVFSSFGSMSVPDLIRAHNLEVFLAKYSAENSISASHFHADEDNQPSPATFDTETGNMGLGRGPNSPATTKDGLNFHAPMTPPPGSNPHTPASPHMSNMQSNQHQQNFGSSPATSFSLASPPSISGVGQSASPGVGLMSSNSPNPLSLPSPSPLHIPSASPQPSMIGHSPAGAGSFMGGHLDGHGSPFQNMASPGAANWPGSPAMPRPSPARPGQSPTPRPGQSPGPEQQQPQSRQMARPGLPGLPGLGAGTSRMWAARPTLVTCKSLELLCRPCVAPPPGPNMPQPQGQPGILDLCPLERFLGCVFMSRQMHRFIQAEEMLVDLRTEDPAFKTECLQCRLIQNPYHFQTLHLKVAALPEYKEQLSLDEIQIIEKFFEMRVACPPFKPNNLLGLARILCTPLFVLRDFIQIMKFDLMPNLAQQANFKWTVQLCLRVPPSSAAPIVPTGQAGVLLFRNKILCFIQLTRICVGPGERASIVLPLVYDVAHRNTQVAEKREPGPALAVTAANIQLKRFAEYAASSHIGQESMLLLAVRDLLMNLNLPSDMSQVGMGSNGCHSPAGMMHSPLGMPMGGMGPMGPMGGMGHSIGHGMGMGPGPHGGMGMHVGPMGGPMGGMGMGPMGSMGPMVGGHSPGMGMGHGGGHGGGMGIGHGMPHMVPMSMMAPIGPMGNQMGSSMGSSMSMCGPMSGPMGSPMPHSGPMGSPMPGPMGSPMGGPGPMGGGPMGGGPMGPMSGPGAMSGPGPMSGPGSMGSMSVPMGPASHIGQHPMMGP